MVYSHEGNDLFCGFYVGSTATVSLEGSDVRLRQVTRYPYEGNVKIEVEPSSDGHEFTMWLRIPTWCTDRFMPGELYRYADGTATKATVAVNGE